MIEYVYLLKRKGRERRIKMKRFALTRFNVTLRNMHVGLALPGMLTTSLCANLCWHTQTVCVAPMKFYSTFQHSLAVRSKNDSLITCKSEYAKEVPLTW